MSRFQTAVVFGASGGIGRALTEALATRAEVVHAVGRRLETLPTGATIQCHKADITEEAQIAALAPALGSPDLVLVATGVLSDATTGLSPEKSYRQQDLQAFEQVFRSNTFGPALVAKHLLDQMPRDRRTVFAALGARVGSISDNRLGGWHAYRASKAALVMLMRNYAIERARKAPEAICVCLHPGTVRSAMSAPFQGNVPEGKLFEPAFAAAALLNVLDGLSPSDSGKQFDYAGREIPF